MIHADNISFDSDDGRFTLIVQGDEGECVIIDIHSVALDFYAQVRREMDDYVSEADQARADIATGSFSVRAEIMGALADSGYALDDPKSPGYHDRMVD